jgi:hypothetical protein
MYWRQRARTASEARREALMELAKKLKARVVFVLDI